MGCSQSTPAQDGPVHNVRGDGKTQRQVTRSLHYGTLDFDVGGPRGKKNITNNEPPKLDANGRMLPEEVAKRTMTSISNHEATLGTGKNKTLVQYAHWTQRGYYPDDPHKQNQDDWGIHLNFGDVKTDAMFAVYDGHGGEGHSCAAFAKNKLPKAVAKHIRKKRSQKYQAILKEEAKDPTKAKEKKVGWGMKNGWDPDKWPMLTQDEYEQCCHKAFLDCNVSMHNDPKVFDMMSGTTAVSVHFHDNFFSVCNVGDSRVVLGHRVSNSGSGPALRSEIDDEVEVGGFRKRPAPPGTRLLAIPLTRDQTPYRRDERERVKKYGAVVKTLDQLEGKEKVHENWGDMVLGEAVDMLGDPPRVWAKDKPYPGCAFTRSLGDAFSDSIGVTGEPEILTKQLTENDECLVIASDGIFEFLKNQPVIEICAACETPLEACEKLVKESYQQWLVHEKRIDDITLIVCFLRNFLSPPTEGAKGTTEDLIEMALSGEVYGTDTVDVSERVNGSTRARLAKDHSVRCAEDPETAKASDITVKTDVDQTSSSPSPEPLDMDLDERAIDAKLEILAHDEILVRDCVEV